ncbi:glycogen synthase GlgA [Fusobacterium sp. IOR10]|uniref:glycogen synthase GlgA n=1 Tax=Fusobacterium sp. IOR10 TaxID=2665157 RepID=UPI0013D1B61F|nr:glycogen synthase GlgA [Fusobacterium sp. IOR10]
MKILFVASEAAPFIKTGGLADVAHSLPKALKKSKVDIRVIIPKYKKISSEYTEKMDKVGEFTVPVGWRNQYCGLYHLKYDGVDFYFMDNEYYFKRNEPYGHFDDGEIFSFFSRGVLESIKHMDGFIPDVIHCNDWHSGMVPVLLDAFYRYDVRYQKIRTLFTIHNLKYQGIFSKTILGELLGLDNSYFTEEKLKFYDGVSFIKGGLIYSDIVTTVSKTYAEEIKTPYFGENLDGLLNGIDYKLYGIVNGIDYSEYNPRKDKNLFKEYGITTMKNKVINKEALQKEMGLPVDKDIPVMGMITRLVGQKGLDLVKGVIEDIISLDLQLIVVGTGDEMYEDLFNYYGNKYPNKVKAYIGFNESVARRVYAGSDMFLMPSQFEPCGIGQLIALRYGTVPIVRETGGLRDTVQAYDHKKKTGNGFSFTNYNAHDMLHVIKLAMETFKNKKEWLGIEKNAMRSEISWKESAKKYRDIYKKLKED